MFEKILLLYMTEEFTKIAPVLVKCVKSDLVTKRL